LTDELQRGFRRNAKANPVQVFQFAMSGEYNAHGAFASPLGSAGETGNAQDFAAANMVGWLSFAISLISPLPCWMFMCAFKKYKKHPAFGKPIRGIYILGWIWVIVVLLSIILGIALPLAH